MQQLSLFSDISTEIKEKPRRNNYEISPQQLSENPSYFADLIADLQGMIDPLSQKIVRDKNWESLGGSYWKILEYSELTKVFRWRLDTHRKWFLSVTLIKEGKCHCKSSDCLHLRAIRYIKQREKQAKEREIVRQQKKHDEQIEAQRKQEREQILDLLRDKYFEEAKTLGLKMYRKPFFDLNLSELKNLQEEICT